MLIAIVATAVEASLMFVAVIRATTMESSLMITVVVTQGYGSGIEYPEQF